ncbi:hypothetical protein [Microbispora rosea]|uniref:hypothetical protein n=1 Tax=Microbispora rosea TaxID=58117 RepID=UPI000A649375|nr:hypothetical protein [Microbispora rosea]
MLKPGMPKKSEAQQILRDIKTKAAKAAKSGDRLAARQYEAHAELITDKLGRGDYED